LSGVNIQLGKATMFHFNHPQEAAQLREKRIVGGKSFSFEAICEKKMMY